MTRRPARHASVAATLVELMVVLALLAAIGALTLGIMSETDAASRAMGDRQAALQYCNRALEAITTDLRRAVDASNFDALAGEPVARPVFGADRVSLLAIDRDGAPVRWSLTTRAEGPQRSHLERRRDPVAVLTADRPASQRLDDPGGRLPDGYTASVRFAYAETPHPAGVTFVDEWPYDRPPALIRVTVQAAPAAGTQRPIVLETAVMPGLSGVMSRPSRTEVDTTATASVATAPRPGEGLR